MEGSTKQMKDMDSNDGFYPSPYIESFLFWLTLFFPLQSTELVEIRENLEKAHRNLIGLNTNNYS
ncbi:hypothetical protein H5410_022210, partial [Solanum commersonii]